MAEYLCEEDMSTGEYISRDLALRQLNATCLATDCNNYNGVRCRACAYADAMDFIDAIPAADVQPVNQWISVDDEEKPDDFVDVLVCMVTNGRCKIRVDFFDKERCSFTRYKGCGITHWMPLPEPPKDGESK